MLTVTIGELAREIGAVANQQHPWTDDNVGERTSIMNGRYWYQDGWVVLTIAGVVGFFGYSFYVNEVQRATPQITPSLSGRVLKPLFGPPSLEINVWHQHPATLRNVQLFVSVNADPARAQESWIKREHSFESWSPNRDQAKTFTFPLPQYDPQREIAVTIILAGKSIQFSMQEAIWLGSGWKEEP